MRKLIIAVVLAFLFAFQIQAQGPIKVYMPIITADVDNNFRIIQPLASSNKVLNPSAEIAGNFSAVGGATATRSTDFQKYGLFSYRVQPAASDDGIQLTTLTLTNAHHFITLRVRGSFTSLRASLNGNLKPLTLIEKIDSNWDLYGASFGASLTNGATALQITDTASGDFYIDGIQAEPQTVWTTYIDGTQEGCAWQGAAHAASSDRSGESRAGGISYDLFEQYQFQVQRIVGAGASSHNLSIDSYAILPGGELNSDKIESRDFSILGMFIANTEEELHEKRQELEAAFQTDDNQLTRIRFNGAAVQKEIAVRYNGGLEGDLAAFYGNIEIVADEQYMDRKLFTEKASIQVIAPDPDWHEVGESVALLDTNDSATFRIVTGRLKRTGQWDNLGPPGAGGTYNQIHRIAEDNTYVYFGGDFLNFDGIANADYIVRWHKVNQSWSALDVGLNDVVNDLAIAPNGDLFIVGDFTNAGGIAAADYITRWDGTNFNAVGVPNTGAAVITTVQSAEFDLLGNLYIGGDFTNWNDIANADYIVMWDGSNYSALSTGTNDIVIAIAVDRNNLVYIGGTFTSPETRVASWDGSAFNGLSTGMNSSVVALEIGLDGFTLFAAGAFTIAGGEAVNWIASWNGTGWSKLGDGITGGISVNALELGPDGVLYAGGLFLVAGGIDLADGIARWNNFVWAHLDIDLPSVTGALGILASNSDPVVEQIYDLYLGFSTTGTGTFGGLVTANNEGSVQAFPKIIYARSGGTSATIETLKNERTGKELLFNYSLLDGETLVIDLEPTQKSIISSFFGSRLDAVLANSDFGIWALPRGDSDVTSYVNVVGGPTITAFMQWRDAYSGYD